MRREGERGQRGKNIRKKKKTTIFVYCTPRSFGQCVSTDRRSPPYGVTTSCILHPIKSEENGTRDGGKSALLLDAAVGPVSFVVCAKFQGQFQQSFVLARRATNPRLDYCDCDARVVGRERDNYALSSGRRRRGLWAIPQPRGRRKLVRIGCKRIGVLKIIP